MNPAIVAWMSAAHMHRRTAAYSLQGEQTSGGKEKEKELGQQDEETKQLFTIIEMQNY